MLLKHPWLGNDSSVSTGATARSASVSLSRGMEEKRAEVEETEGRRDDDEDDAKEVEAFLTARAESERAPLGRELRRRAGHGERVRGEQATVSARR